MHSAIQPPCHTDFYRLPKGAVPRKITYASEMMDIAYRYFNKKVSLWKVYHFG